MRHYFLAATCATVLALCAYLGAKPQGDLAKVRLRLVDAAGGKSLAGIVRIFPRGQDQPAPLPGLLERMKGLSKPELALGWHVIPAEGADIILVPDAYRLEAFAGLETGLARQEIDLRQKVPEEIQVKLDFLFRPERDDLVPGNTHLHLKEMSLEQADDYLLKIPPADGLRVLFISYLERVKDDLTYITNKYPVGDLPRLQTRGVLVNNGEEHRHNFQGWGQGYGHVMFLNIQKLVQPVSIGPGITGKGFDDPALRPGIDNARGQGGTIIWCHNTNGYEDVPHFLAGRVHALNVFDGSRTGNFEDNYYRYLNIGLPVPISTGTDWFMYDFARVYARVPGKLTIAGWLDALKAGRCQATNGPLLSLKVAGKDMGETVALTKPQTVTIEASALGRSNFQTLELVHNGKVIRTQTSAGKGPFTAKMVHEATVDAPGWFAVRVAGKMKNELDRPLFGHSSPVYVEVAAKKIFDVESAQSLLKQVDEGRGAIAAQARFSSQGEREKTLALYDEAARDLRDRINRRGQ